MWKAFARSNVLNSLQIFHSYPEILFGRLPVLVINSSFRTFYVQSNNCLFKNSSQHLNIDKCRIDYTITLRRHLWRKYRKHFSRGNKSKCIRTIMKLFGSTEEEANNLVEKHPLLFLHDIESTLRKVNHLLDVKVPVHFIKQNLWLLQPISSDLKSRLNCMKQWEVDDRYFLDLLPLLKLDYVEYYLVSGQFVREKTNVPYGNRIIYLAKSLESPVMPLTERLVQISSLLRNNFCALQESLEAYRSFRIRNDQILNDVACLTYSKEQICKRLSTAEMNKIKPLKTRFVRCGEESLWRIIEIHKKERMVFLPFKSREEYLAAKLKVDMQTIEELKVKAPYIQCLGGKKLVEVMEFLINAGYSAEHLMTRMQKSVLSISIAKMKQRLEELTELGMRTPSLFVLSHSQQRYIDFVERIRSAKFVEQN